MRLSDQDEWNREGTGFELVDEIIDHLARRHALDDPFAEKGRRIQGEEMTCLSMTIDIGCPRWVLV